MGHAQRTAFITGITGQLGSFLAELLLSKGYKVAGLVRPSSDVVASRERITCFTDNPNVRLHYGDLCDQAGLTRLLREIRPDEIYNLAAMSHVGISFQVPCQTGEVTGLGVLKMLEAMRDACPEARFYQASSSELFGDAAPPQSESTPFRPRSPYASAKLFGFTTAVNYREAYGLHVSNGILFNAESQRRGPGFVTRKITRGVARIKLGLDKVIKLGNLNARRDWMHAKDAVRGMWLMLQQEKPGDFVLATGRSETTRMFCALAFHAAFPDAVIEWRGIGPAEQGILDIGFGVLDRTFDLRRNCVIEVDPQYLRPTEVDYLRGDATRAREILGWQPEITLEQLVKEMVECDLKRESGRV